jgi:hypothetical protein
VSFWKRERHGDGQEADQEGWDVLILTDPGMENVRTSREGRDIPVGEYVRANRLRYANFLDPMADEKPPNTSMLDDLCFFSQIHETTPTKRALDSPALVRTLCAKIVASHYTLPAEYIESILCNAHFRMRRQQDMSVFNVFMAESQWSDVHAYHNRVRRFTTRLEGIMLQLNIPLHAGMGDAPRSMYDLPTKHNASDDVGKTGGQSWTDLNHDYQTLHHKFTRLYVGVEHLNSSITGLVSIAGNRQALADQKLSLAATERSIREARSTKALTSVGLVFIPLAYMSSLFSMSAPFGPGGSMFWLYFVVSLPLVAIVMGGYWVLDFGYSGEGSEGGGQGSWSLRTLSRTLKQTWRARKAKIHAEKTESDQRTA